MSGPGRTKALLLALTIVTALAGCDCGGGGVGSTTAGFRTDTRELDFGKTLEGAEVTRQLELLGTGRVEVLVELETTGPFRAPQTVLVPGGGVSTFGVTFTAPEGEAEGLLRLTARGETFEVTLRGRGVRPLPCVPSAVCRESRFDLQSESCVEGAAPEGSACPPENLCLENGQCRAGACVGTPRSCDDGNLCTRDACSPQAGCVNTDITSECPDSENLCERATCEPLTGCGIAPVEDGVLCGPADCTSVSLCSSGACTKVPTPDGTVCAPRTPCADVSRCNAGACVQPDAGPMIPLWSVPLGDTVTEPARQPGRLRALAGNVYFDACGLQSQDGGCSVLSYTPNGFLRFESPLDAGPGETVLHGASSGGVLVSNARELTALLTSNGARAWSLPLESVPFAPAGSAAVLPRGSVALQRDGGVWAAASFAEANGTGAPVARGVALLRLLEDGGIGRAERVEDARHGSTLALAASGPGLSTDRGALWLHGSGGPLVRFAPLEPVFSKSATPGLGAVTLEPTVFGDFDGGALSAVLRGEGAAVGGRAVVATDGGVTELIDSSAPGSGELPLDFEALTDGESVYAFFRACEAPAPQVCLPELQTTLLRATPIQENAEGWEAPVLPGSVEGRLIEAALTASPLPGGVLTLTEATPLTGHRTDLQLFLPGGRALLCELEGGPEVEGALFEGAVLYALVSRGGRLRLEAYDLAGIPLLRTHWPRPNGAGTGRREDLLP